MDYDQVKIWIDVGQFLITGAIGVYIYLVNKNDATNKRIAKVERDSDLRLDDHEGRITTMEAAMKFLPTHTDMTQVASSIASLQATAEGQTELLQRLTKQVDRVNDWLIDRAK